MSTGGELAIFWDFENLFLQPDQIAHVVSKLREKASELKPGAHAHIKVFMNTSEPFFSKRQVALTAVGVDVQNSIFNQHNSKEASDKAIIMHSLVWLYGKKGGNSAVMFVTADSDFTVLISKIRELGIDAFLVTKFQQGEQAQALRQVATQPVVDWETLLHDFHPWWQIASCCFGAQEGATGALMWQARSSTAPREIPLPPSLAAHAVAMGPVGVISQTGRSTEQPQQVVTGDGNRDFSLAPSTTTTVHAAEPVSRFRHMEQALQESGGQTNTGPPAKRQRRKRKGCQNVGTPAEHVQPAETNCTTLTAPRAPVPGVVNPGWTKYQDNGSIWYYFEGPQGKWWVQDGVGVVEPYPDSE
mmetsp:Transcript_64501/g.120013  ORF Transcript_64501/g.120013 Transcript_64501/m.120013 type:complete len:358 (-) Transcript_64501:106-1179(-)